MHTTEAKNNKSAESIQQMHYTFPEHEDSYQCMAEGVRKEMNC